MSEELHEKIAEFVYDEYGTALTKDDTKDIINTCMDEFLKAAEDCVDLGGDIAWSDLEDVEEKIRSLK